MADIIQLLPDSVANQIAAGEVIQRPASVVKELVENAVDAGSDNIKVIIKDAGKTLIQVIDNGVGMSETDARMAFERHATSKIKAADDLFAIRTKGFRGEALASIASIAQVSLKTRQPANELGTEIVIAGSEVESQEPTSCDVGTNFTVKNLFYNVPARRKFLKTNATEFKHILTEFQRIVLTHPNTEFTLIHNEQTILHLPSENARQRIIHVFGKHMNQNLNNIDNKTSIINISGFVGKPEYARKTSGEQYFFINQRYMRHPYFHKAITKAFENILPSDYYPSYFIFLEADPQSIDVNIHPTKTEIKFENEQAIFQILHAAVKESLGKSNVMPSIDFETHGVVDIPVMKRDTEINMPEIPINPNFNPFDASPASKTSLGNPGYKKEGVPENWQDLYAGARKSTNEFEDTAQPNQSLFSSSISASDEEVPREKSSEYLQVKGKYILTTVKSGLMVIDQKCAHERILFERFIQNMAMNRSATQRSLYPDKIDLNPEDYALFQDINEDLAGIGFDLSDLGSNSVVINGVPETSQDIHPIDLVEQVLEEYKQTNNAIESTIKEKIAISLARAAAVPYGKNMFAEEMQNLVDELFACENPNYTPTGKKTLSIVKLEDFEKLLA